MPFALNAGATMSDANTMPYRMLGRHKGAARATAPMHCGAHTAPSL